MIYFYDIAIKYKIGNKDIIKLYKKSFTEIGKFFIEIEKRHKDNYEIISIREHKQYGKKFNKIYFFEEFIGG